MNNAQKVHEQLRGRWLITASLLCALLAAAVVVGPPSRSAEAATSGQSDYPPASPTTSVVPEMTTLNPPSPPSRLRASLSESSVSLSWTNPFDDTIYKYQYRIRNMDAESDYGEWRDIPNSRASTVSYSVAITGSGRHNVQLRAVNAGGSGSHAVASTGVPMVPSRLRAVLVSGGSVFLSWDDPGDDSIGGYQYRIKNMSTGSAAYGAWIDIADSGSSTTSYMFAVTESGRRVVQLRARLSNGPWGSLWGQPASTSTGPPARPSGFATPGGWSWGVEGEIFELNASASSPKGSVTVSWSDPGDDSIVKYRYRFRAQSLPGGYSQWIDIPGSGSSTIGHTFIFPTPEMYRVRLHAVNDVGKAGLTINLKPYWPALAAPSGLRATLNGDLVSLSWDNPYDGSIEKYQYRIKTVGTGNIYGPWTDIANSDSSTTSHTITVTGAGRRNVQLRALRRSLGDPGKPATASTGIPARPSGFTTPGGSLSQESGYRVLTAAATLPKGTIDVSWFDPRDDSIKYQYKFKALNYTGGYSQWIDIPGSELSASQDSTNILYRFVAPTPEVYRIRLRAVNSAGSGDVQIVSLKPSWPALAAPSGLEATLSGDSVSLSWDNPFDGSIEKYQYRIKAAGTGNVYGTWTDIADSDAYTTSHTFTVIGSEHRNVQLRALRHDQIGGPGTSATALTTAPPVTPAPTPLMAPNTPSGLRASGGNGVIDMFWSNPDDRTITGYQYQTRTPSSRDYSEWQSIPGSGASTVGYTIPNLAAREDYNIRLRAGNAAGWGAYRSTHAPTSVTHSPTSVVATPGDGSFTLTWDAPLPRYGITGYKIMYFPHEKYDDLSSYTRADLPASPRSHTVTGLVNGTRYRIWVRAVSAAGESGLLTLFATPDPAMASTE